MSATDDTGGTKAPNEGTPTIQRTLLALAASLPLLGAGALSAQAGTAPKSTLGNDVETRIERIRDRVVEPGTVTPESLAPGGGEAQVLAWHDWLNWGRWHNWNRWLNWGNGWGNWLLW